MRSPSADFTVKRPTPPKGALKGTPNRATLDQTRPLGRGREADDGEALCGIGSTQETTRMIAATTRGTANFGSRGGVSDGHRCEEHDPRDVFTKDLDLRRGRERRPVRERDRVYDINGAESRMLATIGAFRVVAESDLRGGCEDTRRAQRHFEREGLLQTSPLSSDDGAVVLTDRGRDLLEANRHEPQRRTLEPRQIF
jgi:hypothetical protein